MYRRAVALSRDMKKGTPFEKDVPYGGVGR